MSTPAPKPLFQYLTADFNFDPAQQRAPNGQWIKGGSAVGANNAIVNGEPAPSESTPIGQAPDGTPVEATGFRRGGKGLRRTVGAILSAAARIVTRWPSEGPDIPSSPPSSAEQTPFEKPNLLETDAKSKLFTPAENAALVKLFKGGGEDGNEIGAQPLLDQLDQGKVDLPPGISRGVLERYAQIARKAISEGIDNAVFKP